MKISVYIFLSFGFILFLFATTTFINFRLSKAVTENEDYLSKSSNIIKNSSRFQRNILTMVNGLRGYLLTGEKSFLESYDASNKDNDSILAELSSILIDSPQTRLLDTIKNLNKQWIEEYTEPLRQAKILSDISSGNLNRFNKFYKEKFTNRDERSIQRMLQEKFRVFTAYEYKIRETRKQRLSDSAKKTRILSFTLMLISIITAMAVIRFVINKISWRIKQMTYMADAVAAGNYHVNVPDNAKDELSPLGYSLNHMAKKLSKNIDLLKKTNAELDQFAHIVSHDLKGPLRGIDNVVSWINEDHQGELSPKLQEYMAIIKRRIERAENLIEGLLSYARIDKEEIEKEVVDLNILIEEILDTLPVNKNIKIDIDPLPTVLTEKILLYQVFYNLISNAIKHNNKEVIDVKVYYTENDTDYTFYIKDNGHGIATNYHNRIFVIFQTLNDKDSFESTGVGLAIVKKILDSKNKTITLVSEPGKGSVFSFNWPKA